MAPAIGWLAPDRTLDRGGRARRDAPLASRPPWLAPGRFHLHPGAMGGGLQRRRRRRGAAQHPAARPLQRRAGRGGLPLSLCGVSPHRAADPRPARPAGAGRWRDRGGARRPVDSLRRLCAWAGLLRRCPDRCPLSRSAHPAGRRLAASALRGGRTRRAADRPARCLCRRST